MSNCICVFLEWLFPSTVFLHGGSIYLQICTENLTTLFLARLWKAVNIQSKKNADTFIYMWFMGFTVKDTIAGIVPMASLTILSSALRRGSSTLGLLTLKYSSTRKQQQQKGKPIQGYCLIECIENITFA